MAANDPYNVPAYIEPARALNALLWETTKNEYETMMNNHSDFIKSMYRGEGWYVVNGCPLTDFVTEEINLNCWLLDVVDQLNAYFINEHLEFEEGDYTITNIIEEAKPYPEDDDFQSIVFKCILLASLHMSYETVYRTDDPTVTYYKDDIENRWETDIPESKDFWSDREEFFYDCYRACSNNGIKDSVMAAIEALQSNYLLNETIVKKLITL